MIINCIYIFVWWHFLFVLLFAYIYVDKFLFIHCAHVVNVKHLHKNGVQKKREFIVEVLMLSLWHHRNLVNIIGYCVDGDQMILVYEYMPLVSLEDHLYGIDISNHIILGSLRVNEIFMNTLVLLLL